MNVIFKGMLRITTAITVHHETINWYINYAHAHIPSAVAH